MAIDTAQKRFSFVGFGCPIPQSVTVPSGSVDAAARADLLYLYSGIAITAPVTVPDIVGLTQAAADSALIAEGLVSGTVTSANSDSVAVGLVISQDPAAGGSVASGSSVDYVISLGAAAVSTGGGGGLKKHRRTGRRYPRRVMVDGKTYWVRNAREERDLIQMLLAASREEAEKAQEALAEAQEAAPVPKRVRAKIRRMERRLEKAEDEVDTWMQYLRERDEDIIMLLAN